MWFCTRYGNLKKKKKPYSSIALNIILYFISCSLGKMISTVNLPHIIRNDSVRLVHIDLSSVFWRWKDLNA